MKGTSHFTRASGRYQSGVVTTFTGILILVLLTLMMFFAIRVGLFEQRVSSNEMRQKRAFHAAESGIQHAKEYFKAHTMIVASNINNVLGDEIHGWRAEGAERWQPCSEAGLDLTGTGSHPCFAEPDPAERANLYYWSYLDSLSVPVATGDLLPGTTETVDV